MFCIWCNFCWRYNVMQVNDVVSVMNGNPWVVANLAIKQLLLISVQGCWNSIYFTDTHTSTHTHTGTRKCRDYVHETRAYILQRTYHETAFVWYKKYTKIPYDIKIRPNRRYILYQRFELCIVWKYQIWFVIQFLRTKICQDKPVANCFILQQSKLLFWCPLTPFWSKLQLRKLLGTLTARTNGYTWKC